MERQGGDRREKFNCWKVLYTYLCINSATVLLSYRCCNKLPQIKWLKTKQMTLQPWISENLKLTCQQDRLPHAGSRAESITLPC